MQGRGHRRSSGLLSSAVRSRADYRGTVPLTLLTALVAACGPGGGGGGSGASFDKSGQLVAVTFLDPQNVNVEAVDAAPTAAPLVQQIVFTFSGNPDPNKVGVQTFQVRDANNLPVAGHLDVTGNVVTFTPTLPTRPGALNADGSYDTGGASLEPGASYTVRLGPSTFSFVASVATAVRSRFPDPLDSKGVLIKFTTTTNVADFFKGIPNTTPQLLTADPLSGTTGVSPHLYTDPDQLFPPSRSFFLTFDRPLNPDPAFLSDATIQLIDLDDRPSFFPNGLPLGADVRLIENEIDHAKVEITPSGILPFGHMLAIDYPTDVHGLSETAAFTGVRQVATTFTVASAPAATIHDVIVENFDTTDRQEKDPSLLGVGNLPADWDKDDSNILSAGFEFQGTGVLGDFRPPAPAAGDTTVIYLDTARQTFPLPDGSTPDAPPNYEVVGGVFAFEDIDIPDGVIIRPLGTNPLVLTATGNVRIAGDILLNGDNGNSENAYDSAVTSVPGGAGVAGGGRGGESHPIVFYPAGQLSYLTLVSPQFGGQGYGIDPNDGQMKRVGGTGGMCGADDDPKSGKYGTDYEYTSCDEFRNGNGKEKAPGGGGGSMFTAGETPTNKSTLLPLNSDGNARPDGTGKFTVSSDTNQLCGGPGLQPFFDDGVATNNFFGTKGQLKRLIGGQGGGGGGSLTESYYCSKWCLTDSDTGNDSVCCPNNNTKCDPFVVAGTRAGSVGDARGGGAGGGGGALLIQALGTITITASCLIDARGGIGGGGESLGCSYWGGGGAGGSGGFIGIQSGTSILVSSGAVLDVTGGQGDDAENDNFYFVCDNGTSNGDPGDAGDGGNGLIQLQVPAGATPTIVNASTSLKPLTSWVDQTNTLNPVEFTRVSVALSTWFDVGRVTTRAPANTNPLFSFGGLDASGLVITDANGYILNPSATDISCGYLGQLDPLKQRGYLQGEEPINDFIPTDATIKVEFQGANPIVEGSSEVDPTTLTSWSVAPAIANGMKFLRWRVTLDIDKDASGLTPSQRLPAIQSVQVHAHF